MVKDVQKTMDLQSIGGRILAGNLLFVACCIVYLAWWCVAFRPGFTAPMSIKGILFLVTAALGIMGLGMIISGCNQAEGGIRYIAVIAAGAAVYILLLLLTNLLMHRQVTTELMLIVFWVCMQVCACNALYGADIIGRTAFIVLAVIAVVVAAAGMICYLKYYELEPMPAFYDGMVPLILFALTGLGFAAYIWTRLKGA